MCYFKLPLKQGDFSYSICCILRCLSGLGLICPQGCKNFKLNICNSITSKIKPVDLILIVKIQKIYQFLCLNSPKNQAVYQHIINTEEEGDQRE
jgi:hypothetical protein